MKPLLPPLIALSAAGLLASVVVHLCALAGVANPFGPYAWALHIGIFVVWLPAVLVMNRLTANVAFKQNDLWKVALAGCPPWMRRMVYGFFIYAFVNFALFFALSTRLPKNRVPQAMQLRGFSGHWMAFYAAAWALLYAAGHRVTAKCASGHDASPAAKFCERCGAPVTVSGA